MKAILKTMPENMELKVDKTFTSKTNTRRLKRLIPELVELLAS
jgi:hypothetical protein